MRTGISIMLISADRRQAGGDCDQPQRAAEVCLARRDCAASVDLARRPKAATQNPIGHFRFALKATVWHPGTN